MISDKIDRYIKIANKFGVTPDLVRQVIEGQFDIANDIMCMGEDHRIRLKYLGECSVKPGRRELLELKRDVAKRMALHRKESKQNFEYVNKLRQRIKEITYFSSRTGSIRYKEYSY